MRTALLCVVILAGCYRAPSVSEPPTLDQPQAFLQQDKVMHPPEKTLRQVVPARDVLGQVCAPGASDCGYRFFYVIPGAAGRFDNGNPEAEQWVPVRHDCAVTVAGQPLASTWQIARQEGDLESDVLEVGVKSANAAVELSCSVFDALDRRSNVVTLSLKLAPPLVAGDLFCGLKPGADTKLDPMQRTGSAPTATGGALADGQYSLTGLGFYGEASQLPSLRIAALLYLKAGRYEWEGREDSAFVSSAGTTQIAGNAITFSSECGPRIPDVTYSTTANGVTLYEQLTGGGTLEYVFQRLGPP